MFTCAASATTTAFRQPAQAAPDSAIGADGALLRLDSIPATLRSGAASAENTVRKQVSHPSCLLNICEAAFHDGLGDQVNSTSAVRECCLRRQRRRSRESVAPEHSRCWHHVAVCVSVQDSGKRASLASLFAAPPDEDELVVAVSASEAEGRHTAERAASAGVPADSGANEMGDRRSAVGPRVSIVGPLPEIPRQGLTAIAKLQRGTLSL